MSDVGPEEGWCQVADTLIVADRVVPATGADIFMPGFVRISRGTIAEVARGRPAGTADLELTDGVLVPGFVDLQVNGHSFRYAAGVPTIPSGSLNRSPRRSASCSTPAAGCCGSSHSLPNGPGPSLP